MIPGPLSCMFYNLTAPTFEATARKALATAGLHAEVSLDSVSTPAVLFFGGSDDELLATVRSATHNGELRLLAIAEHSGLLRGDVPWSLLRAGASDVIAWSSGEDSARECALRLERWATIEEIVNSTVVRENLVGSSSAWRMTLRRIVEAARFTDAAVLIEGESGTGKELVARLIHTLDPRPEKRDLVVVDCSTVVSELSGSEFFGHERGAFTGASASRPGALELADGGTLFLDEVGELPLPLQAQLLRAVQEKSYKRVGGNDWKRSSFRLVCATNRELPVDVEGGTFRRDLYYRIAGLVFHLPPLRERAEDIVPLAEHFLRAQGPRGVPIRLDEPVREFLLRRSYPGNVRELRQLVSRMLNRYACGEALTVGQIPDEERPATPMSVDDWCDGSFDRIIRRALSMGAKLKDIGRAAENAAVRIVESEEEGNLQRAACRLGVTDRALQIRRATRRQLPYSA